jgi:GNAT superfamily N-acetyltransferase
VTIQTIKELAAALPDIPRWLKVRSMLLTGTGEVFGVMDDPPSFAAFSPHLRIAVVVGRPAADAIIAAVGRRGAQAAVLADDDNLDHVLGALDGWTVSPSALHLQRDSSRLPSLVPDGPGAGSARPFAEPHPLPVPADQPGEDVRVRMVSGADIAGFDLPPELNDELMRATLVGKLGATFVDGAPVSFCDAMAETESLWDVGIETLEPHRRRGYAGLAVAFMADQMGRRGKRPVWAAEESNTASVRLASKLGFARVDRRYVLRAPA